MSSKRAYRAQIDNSRRRGIEFNFSYREWLDFWGDDLKDRGKCKGQLVMARKGDRGPYSIENVYIVTGEANRAEISLEKRKAAAKQAWTGDRTSHLENKAKHPRNRAVAHHGEQYVSAAEASRNTGNKARTVNEWCRRGRYGWAFVDELRVG